MFVLTLLAREAGPGPTVRFDETLLTTVSQSNSFEFRDQPIPHYLGYHKTEEVLEDKDSVSLASITVAADVRGYAGPINLLVAVDKTGILRGVRYIESDETPAYIADIDHWLATLTGKDISHSSLRLDDIDALTGATISSRAALESINRAVQAGGYEAFEKSWATVTQPIENVRTTFEFIIVLALLILFFPVYRFGHDKLRLFYQFAALIVLGFSFNVLVTEIDLINISLGHFPSLNANPLSYLMIGFVILTAFLLGQAYCGYVCPFGALQELISWIGRFFYLRSYVARPLETRMRYIKFVLLALMLMTFWITEDLHWITFNPMQHFFSGHFNDWMIAITLITLIGALFYYRFWCRYFCPFGAFIALSNKGIFFKQFAKKRRFEYCDLGVRDEYDIDCIHCQRCVTGKEVGKRSM